MSKICKMKAIILVLLLSEAVNGFELSSIDDGEGHNDCQCQPGISFIGPAQNECHWNGKEILSSSSGGLALRGVYVSFLEEKMLQRRRITIDVNDNVVVRGASQPQRDYSLDFDSQKESKNFIQTMNKYGVSFAANANLNILFVKANAGFNTSKVKENTVDKTSESKSTYFSSVKCSNIPMKSIDLEPYNIKLNKGPIRKLINIETKLNNDPQGAKELFEDFFENYGSHILWGIFELGGTIIKKAETTFESNNNIENTKYLVRKSSEIYAGIGINEGGKIGGGVNFSTNFYNEDQNNTKQTDRESSKNIKVTLEKRGGAAGEDSIPEWKKSLSKNSDSWVVIERPTRLISIWELIRLHHLEVFENGQLLATRMDEAWHNIEKENIENQRKIDEENIAEQRKLDKQKIEKELSIIGTLGTSLETADERRKILQNIIKNRKVAIKKGSKYSHLYTNIEDNRVLMPALTQKQLDESNTAMIKFDTIQHIPSSPYKVYLKLQHGGFYLGLIEITLNGNSPGRIQNFMMLATGNNDAGASWTNAKIDGLGRHGKPQEFIKVNAYVNSWGTRYSTPLVSVERKGPRTAMPAGQVAGYGGQTSAFWITTKPARSHEKWDDAVIGHVTSGLEILQIAAAKGEDYVKGIKFIESGIVVL